MRFHRCAHRLMRVAPCTLVLSFAAAAHAVTPTAFTVNNPIGGAPVGWTFAGNKFVGTVLGDGTNRVFSTDLVGGNIQPFGGTVSLNTGYGQEHYVSASLGLGGFPLGDIYVASGNNIQHISNAGVADPGLFVSGSTPINGLVRGIMFDNVGTFGNNMLITTDQGNIYSVTSTGAASLIQSTGEDTEGLDICPLNGTWGTMNGWLFVACEGSGTIRAIKPTGYAMSTIITYGTGSFEQLNFVPMTLGNDPLAGMYSANYPQDVLFMGASQFAGMEGDIILTGETNSTIFRLTPSNALTTIGSFPNQPEDGIFLTNEMLANFGIPEPASLALVVPALLLLVRSRRR